MKKPHLALVAAPLIFAFAGCSLSKKIVGSGNVVTKDMPIADFIKVDASHEFNVTVTAGPAFKVEIRTDDNMLPELIVEKSDDVLMLDLKESNYNLQGVTLDAAVTMPSLGGISLSGVTKGKVTGFKSDQPLQVRLSGATRLEGDIEAGATEIRASGASSINLTGKGTMLTTRASGASTIELKNFPTENADAHSTGASHISLHINGTLNAEASGASSVTYSGDPTIGKSEISGASKVEKRGL